MDEIPVTDEQVFDYDAEIERVKRCVSGIKRVRDEAYNSGLSGAYLRPLKEACYLLNCYVDTLTEAQEEESA
jgi:hypothetical protein